MLTKKPSKPAATAAKSSAKQSAVAAATDKTPRAPGASRFTFSFRLLPITIFAAVLLLGVRVVDLWQLIAARNAPLPNVAESVAREAQPMAAVGDGKTPPTQPPGRMQLAQANTGSPAKEPAAQPPAQGEKKPEADPLGSDALSPINNEQLLKHYADRRAELEKAAKDVSMREALLSAAEKRIEQKLKEMEKVRSEIQNLLKMGDDRQSQQLESLVKIYETMKPKEAARIFEELEMPVLLDVIQKMKENKTAPILAAMDPVKAKQVTSALVERRILPAVPQ